MARTKTSSKREGLTTGSITVSNLPESAGSPVATRLVTEPSTEGTVTVAPAGREGLESVAGYRRAYVAGPRPASAVAAAPRLWMPATKMLPDIGEASFFKSDAGWTSGGDENFNYGAIILPELPTPPVGLPHRPQGDPGTNLHSRGGRPLWGFRTPGERR